ncbi:MAG: hypothetical protein SFU27_08725 [Thermonemataceae bacterium]|nr:hypothetical protein [Thermonemataceae bacterium]
MKSIFITLLLFFTNYVWAQTYWYVVADSVELKESPNVKAKTLKILQSGDSVKVLQSSDKQEKMLVNNRLKQNYWTQVEYNKDTSWVFGGFICWKTMNKDFFRSQMRISDNPENLANFDKLLSDSIIILKGDYIKVKTKNGKFLEVRESACNTENTFFEDGYLINNINILSTHKHIIEFTMSWVAFEVPVYIDTKRGVKFRFSDNYPCMEASVSPNAKYVVGKAMMPDQNAKLLLFRFDQSQKPIAEYNCATYDYSFRWLNNKTVEITFNQTKKKSIWVIPR